MYPEGAFGESGAAELSCGGRGAREKRAGPDGHDDVVGEAPSELLSGLEEERLGPFGVIRAEGEVDEAPALFVGETRAQPIDLVVGPVDADDGRAVRGGTRDLALVGRRGDEDERAQTIARRGSRYRASEVAGGGAGDRVEPELERSCERDGDGPVLERERWVARVVFEEEARHADRGPEARRLHERRPADREVPAWRGDRKERRIPPERERPPLDLGAQALGIERCQVVLRLDRAVALAADVTLVRRLKNMARAAAQTAEPARRSPFERGRHGDLL